jgi:hypothetical protein
MTIRRRRLWLVALAGLVLARGVWVWSASTHVLWVKDVSRIVDGMSRSDVAAALGRPPDHHYQTGYYVDSSEMWEVIDGSIYVQYNRNFRVCDRSVDCLGIYETQKARLIDWWRHR